MIVAPFLLEIKILPDVTTYTVSFISFITAVSNFLQYIITSNFMWDYAIAGAIFGLVGFFIGLNFILSWVIKKNRRSFIVLTLSFAILFSVVLILYTGI